MQSHDERSKPRKEPRFFSGSVDSPDAPPLIGDECLYIFECRPRRTPNMGLGFPCGRLVLVKLHPDDGTALLTSSRRTSRYSATLSSIPAR